jgi:hypothetical protein
MAKWGLRDKMPVAALYDIHGNLFALQAVLAGDISEVPEAFREVIYWTAHQLAANQRQAITDWPSSHELDIAGLGHTLFWHATPRNDTDCVTRVTAEERLTPVRHRQRFRGHLRAHAYQFDRTIPGRRAVNAGSVGMPFAVPRGAYWLPFGPGVQLRRTELRLREGCGPHSVDGLPTGGGASLCATSSTRRQRTNRSRCSRAQS